jgi:FkbM family methyltransferase
VTRVAPAVGGAFGSALGAIVELAVRGLPSDRRLALRDSLAAEGTLDYAGATLRLDVETAIERFRLTSCAKEPETVSWLDASVRPGDAVYDVGANIGAYSLIAAHLAGPGGRCYAFEPGSATFAKLVKNIFLNDFEERMVAFNLGLAEETGLETLSYSSPTAGAAMHTFGAETAPGGQTVMAFRLDELVERLGLRPPNLLKVDVDGSELSVLKGAGRLLVDDGLRSVLVEVEEDKPQTEQIVARLQSNGFEVTGKHKHERSGVSNFIFHRP